MAVLSGGNIDPALLADILSERAAPGRACLGGWTGLLCDACPCLHRGPGPAVRRRLGLLYLAGARGLLLLALALLVSGIASYVLLSRLRDMRRLSPPDRGPPG